MFARAYAPRFLRRQVLSTEVLSKASIVWHPDIFKDHKLSHQIDVANCEKVILAMGPEVEPN